MARTGRGRNAKRSNMPAMVDRLVIDPPLFDHLDLIERHRAGHPGTMGPPKSLQPRAARGVPSRYGLARELGEPSVTWLCPGCGKGLVSAVHQAAPRGMFCTRACREASS